MATPFSGRLATRFNVLDIPDPAGVGHKLHDRATPYFGGLALFAGLAAGAVFLPLVSVARPALTSGKLLLGVALALGVGAIGLADDIKGLPPSLRIAFEAAAATGAWFAGFRVLATPWVEVDFLLTVLWIIGICNAFNLLDNMDGLSSGLAAVSATFFAFIGAMEGLVVIPIVSGALAGAAFGFLRHNRYPARIFMGDAGSLMLGFLLALIGMELRFDNLISVTFLVPVIVLGLPIFDTTLVVLSRINEGRPVTTGARDHVSHRLVAMGLSVRNAVGLLYWVGICLGWLGFVISRANVEVAWLLTGFVIAVSAFFSYVLWRVKVSPVDAGSRSEAELWDQAFPAEDRREPINS